MNVSEKVTVTHPSGLHARPASLFVQTASKFKSEVRIQNITSCSDLSNAKSILSVLTLGVMQGHEIEISAQGEDAQAAIDALVTLIKSNFGESA